MERKEMLRNVMRLAWKILRRNGYEWSRCLRVSWANIKLTAAMKNRIVKFYFQKISGEIREGWGTLQDHLLPEINPENKKTDDTCFIYYDTEKLGWRSFKKANLISII